MKNQTTASTVNYSPESKRRIGFFTRFAVERSIENRFFHTSEGQSWLLKALETASLFSIASVLNLSKKPDVWFILIDETLPLLCAEQINQAFSRVDGVKIEIVKVRDWPGSSDILLNTDERFKACEIQVRLDYDDMLHRDFLEYITKETIGVTNTTIFSPIFGVVLDNQVPKMASD